MSKLAKFIQVIPINERKYVDSMPLTYADASIVTANNIDFPNEAKGYRITATVGAQVFLTDTDSDSLQYATKDTKRAIIEEVFGEFRQPLQLVRRALYERQFDKALQLLGKLEDQMYEAV